MIGDSIIAFSEKLAEYNPSIIFKLLFFTAIIVLYSIFVFFFYKYLAKKDIVELNLNQYNKFSNTGTIKIFGAIFYILEYIIFLPIMTIIWFGVLSILLLVLAKTMDITNILILTASLVASVRITAYVSEKLSQELAKMLPFTLIAMILIGDRLFSIQGLASRILEIPTLFSDLPYYLLFIIIVELSMRLIDLLGRLFGKEDSED